MSPSKGTQADPGPPPEKPADEQQERLLAAARLARGRAYSPYSGLAVGAALLDEAGGIHGGCNVENASLGLTLCAERVALGRAVAEGARRFTALALVSSQPRPLMPCGACRQVLHELAPLSWVISEGDSGERRVLGLAQLLPDAFGPWWEPGA